MIELLVDGPGFHTTGTTVAVHWESWLVYLNFQDTVQVYELTAALRRLCHVRNVAGLLARQFDEVVIPPGLFLLPTPLIHLWIKPATATVTPLSVLIFYEHGYLRGPIFVLLAPDATPSDLDETAWTVAGTIRPVEWWLVPTFDAHALHVRARRLRRRTPFQLQVANALDSLLCWTFSTGCTPGEIPDVVSRANVWEDWTVPHFVQLPLVRELWTP